MRYFRALKHSQPITTVFSRWTLFFSSTIDESQQCMPGMAVHRKMCSIFAFGPDISGESSQRHERRQDSKALYNKTSRTVTTIDNSPCNRSYQWQSREVTQISPRIRRDAAAWPITRISTPRANLNAPLYAPSCCLRVRIRP